MEGNYSCLKVCKGTASDIAAQLSKVRHGYRGEAQEIVLRESQSFSAPKNN